VAKNKTKKVVKKDDNKILVMNVNRENGKTKLFIKVSPEIENVFKTEDTHESNIYKDGDTKHFYYLRKPDTEEELNNLVSDTRISDYGNQLFDGYRTNLSLLRTVGISEGVNFEITHLIGEEMLTKYAERMKIFVLKLYKQFIRKVEINVVLEKVEVY